MKTLENWTVLYALNPDKARLIGWCVEDQKDIVTSKIEKVEGNIATTISGSKYKINYENICPELIQLLNLKNLKIDKENHYKSLVEVYQKLKI